MIKTKITELKDFILEHNTYFDNAFDNTFQNSSNGLVLDNQNTVFPNDQLGNYFYLRLPDEMRFVYNAAKYKIEDCGFSFGISGRLYLIAYVHNGNTDVLFENMVNTLQQFTNADLTFINGSFEKEAIVMQELKKISQKSIQAALQNMNEKDALVSIIFEIATNFKQKKLSCLPNPCGTC